MLGAVLGRRSDPRRLRMLLALLFFALAVPTALVVWQAYGRLKWEAFHQYRSQAEELTRRIDRDIGERIAAAESRGFADYSFFNVGGDVGGGVFQRSPLSAYPVEPQLPGLIGYFQVDADGVLSTPLLPKPGTGPAAAGIGPEEYRGRLELASEIAGILADNRLVGGREAGTAAADAATEEAPAEADALESEPGGVSKAPVLSATEGAGREAPESFEHAERQGIDENLGQRMFDELSETPARDEPKASGRDSRDSDDALVESRAKTFGKVRDLRLDDALNRKSESLGETAGDGYRNTPRAAAPQESAPRSRGQQEGEAVARSPAPPEGPAPDTSAITGAVRVTAFESERDPFEFSQLDTGHFVLFRRVWRDGARYIQGALIDRRAFLADVIESAFGATALADMSDLVVAFRDDVIDVIPARGQARSSMEASGLQGALLYRSRLSAPLDALELIFSVSRLPPGPGAAVLFWMSALLAVVFLGGFFVLHRLGMGQIALARQQQDFVSAVSHELKTPLTSIRMYGEMLKEGWTDENRKRQYYEYIHDESERLTRLIDNVLRLASITRNGLDLDLKAIAAGRLMDRVRSKLESPVERAGFELTFVADDEARVAELRVDEDCFTQIFINLIDNAIKFSRKAEIRRIEISATLTRTSRLRFAVRDHGPGVPRDQMKKIFRLFYRTGRELTRETVGTGIGLAIVHELAAAMSGEVDVVNREPGAEFGVTFPVSK